MKNSLPASLFAFVFVGCASIFSTVPPSDPLERLRYEIDAILSDSLFIPARASIKIVSLDNHKVLYDRDSKVLMRPASNMKLLTSATALHVLGKDYRFKTVVYTDSQIVNGRVLGNVYVKGFGDPDLKTSDLDSLAAQVKSTGISGIIGNVVADVSYFDDLYWGNGWMWDDEPESDEMFISALSVNKNCVKVTVKPDTLGRDSVYITIDPKTNYVTLVSTAKTVKDTVLHELIISRAFKERLNTITVDGEILAKNGSKTKPVSVWRPELYAAQLFKESLERAGIYVSGKVEGGTVALSAPEIARHYERMDSMVVNLNKASDNLSAENSLKTVAATSYGMTGSAEAGIYVVKAFLSSLGIDTTKFLMADGSGVSHYNLLTAEMISQLLVGVYYRRDIFPLFYESLPIAGVDGTLRGRMKATPAEGNLRAKTGTISGVSALSGYVLTRDGEMLAFSMMMQNFFTSSNQYRDAQDRIGALLAGFSRKGRRAVAAN